MESVGAEESYSCELCDRTFFSKSALKIHYRIHTGELPYECSRCGKRYRTKGNLQSHEISHSSDQKHTCPHCPFRTAHASYLPKHIATQHTKDFQHICPVCSKGFFNRHDLEEHLKEKHLSRFKCDVFNVSFASIFATKGYKRCSEQTDGKSHCELCPFSADYEGTSEHPLLSAVKEVHQCEHCGKVCAQKCHLRTHLLTCGKDPHAEKERFRCTKCPYSTKRKGSLQHHLLTHKEPYRCELCDKIFSQKYCLQSHLLIHSGERPYECSVCGKGFSRMSHMQRHEKIHAKAKKSQISSF